MFVVQNCCCALLFRLRRRLDVMYMYTVHDHYGTNQYYSTSFSNLSSSSSSSSIKRFSKEMSNKEELSEQQLPSSAIVEALE
mmetsp:Transcript_8188/g.15874  ORF Transcript_8188/g.15874 Transcript_8188/m.15874 type:complete len:82 (-) Transcript_8188:626-871(-)